MSKTVGVWDCTFYLMDAEGEPIRDGSGEVILYRSNGLDYSWAEHLDEDDLEEIEDAKINN